MFFASNLVRIYGKKGKFSAHCRRETEKKYECVWKRYIFINDDMEDDDDDDIFKDLFIDDPEFISDSNKWSIFYNEKDITFERRISSCSNFCSAH